MMRVALWLEVWGWGFVIGYFLGSVLLPLPSPLLPLPNGRACLFRSGGRIIKDRVELMSAHAQTENPEIRR